MSFKSKEDICIIANRKIIVSSKPLERLRKSAEARLKQRENSAAAGHKKSGKHKDPTDALGSFIAELDVDTIEKNIDFCDIDTAIRKIIRDNGNSIEALVTEDVIVELCKRFDYNVRQLVALFMEKYPKTFDIAFVKTKVKPLIVAIQKDKADYIESNGKNGVEYREIFSLL